MRSSTGRLSESPLLIPVCCESHDVGLSIMAEILIVTACTMMCNEKAKQTSKGQDAGQMHAEKGSSGGCRDLQPPPLGLCLPQAVMQPIQGCAQQVRLPPQLPRLLHGILYPLHPRSRSLCLHARHVRRRLPCLPPYLLGQLVHLSEQAVEPSELSLTAGAAGGARGGAARHSFMCSLLSGRSTREGSAHGAALIAKLWWWGVRDDRMSKMGVEDVGIQPHSLCDHHFCYDNQQCIGVSKPKQQSICASRLIAVIAPTTPCSPSPP